MPDISVLVAEDHTNVRKGLCRLLEGETGIRVVGEAENGREAVALARRLLPDVVLMDITMPQLNGLEATRQIVEHGTRTKVLILTVHLDEEYAAEALRAGASGYLVKDTAPEELASAIRAVHQGRMALSAGLSADLFRRHAFERGAEGEDPYDSLTAREREVLQLIAEGYPNREIASLLHVAVKTIETHRTHILRKLSLDDTAALTRYAIRRGIANAEP